MKELTGIYQKNEDAIENQFKLHHDLYKGYSDMDEFILSDFIREGNRPPEADPVRLKQYIDLRGKLYKILDTYGRKAERVA